MRPFSLPSKPVDCCVVGLVAGRRAEVEDVEEVGVIVVVGVVGVVEVIDVRVCVDWYGSRLNPQC